jgi:hypothetical protein
MTLDLDQQLRELFTHLANETRIANNPSLVGKSVAIAPPVKERISLRFMVVALAAAVVLVAGTTAIILNRDGDRVAPAQPSVDSAATTSIPNPEVRYPAGVQATPLEEASIFYLPQPAPDGWHLAQAIHGVSFDLDWAQDRSVRLETNPPIPNDTFREFGAFFIKSDGSALAQLSVVETPFEVPQLTAANASSVTNVDEPPLKFIELADIFRVGSQVSDPAKWPPGFTHAEDWFWTQDGRSMTLTVIGDQTDAQSLMAAVRPASAAAVANAVTGGQIAGMQLPVISETQLPSGERLTARGVGDRILALCAEGLVPTCGFAGFMHGHAGVIQGIALTSSGAQNFAWVPADIVPTLVPGPTQVASSGGSFVYGFASLGIGSLQAQEVLYAPSTDLLAMPTLTDSTDTSPAPATATTSTIA